MSAHALRMDAAINGSASPDVTQVTRTSPRLSHESPWVLAAIAAAPWPIWSLATLLGVPGAGSPQLSHGVLAFALVLAAMGVWTHRPNLRSGIRWSFAIIGTGLMGEMLCNALTDMGREPGLGVATDTSRALVVWLLCFAVYEVTPIVAATARISRTERRRWQIDAVAHLCFALAALGAYTWQPTWGTAWFVSPWLAVALALPLAAARSGPERETKLPAPHPRGGVLFGAAVIGWGLLIGISLAESEVIAASFHTMRWGVEPAEGVLLGLPTISVGLSMLAAAVLLVRALSARKCTSGLVTELGDGGATLELDGDTTASVVIDAGALPELGSTVTLIGAAPENPGVGPFRDAPQQLRAARVWTGKPNALARSLSHRAGGWLVWSAVSAFGVLLRLL